MYVYIYNTYMCVCVSVISFLFCSVRNIHLKPFKCSSNLYIFLGNLIAYEKTQLIYFNEKLMNAIMHAASASFLSIPAHA